jgi:hypothetical protein
VVNPNEPLGLPRGSVRALLALIVVTPAVAVNSILLATGGAFNAESTILAAGVLFYYFGSRSAAPIAPADEPLPAPATGDDD